MAIIYSYPGKSTPSGGDVLVITDSAQAAPNKNRTKSLTIDNLASYVVSVSGNITGGGTLNTIPLFTPNGEEIGDSIMTFTTGPDTITVGGRLSVTGDLTAQGRSDFTGLYARFNGEVRDGANSSGTAGQVLTSTGAGAVAWATNASSDTTYDLTGAVTGGSDYKVVLTGSDGTVDNVTFEAGTGIVLADQGGNTVQVQAVNNGTVTSVALTMPAAFSVAGSPITSSGTFAVTGAGTASQVVLGDGSLGSLPGGPFLPLAGGTMLGNTLHGDNIKSIYGTGSDLEIYNNGTNSYIESKTANEDLILSVNCFNSTEKFKIEDNNQPGDFLITSDRFTTIIYSDGSEVLKADNSAVELSETLKLSKGITNSLELKSYTATAVSTTGPIDPIQNNYAPTQDTLATLCVDTSGNVVRGEQEATFTFTTAQLNGTLGQTLISAPGAGKAVVVTYTDYMMTYTTTGSTTNDLEIRQANLASPTASVSRLPALRFNEIVNNSQAGVAPFYGFYTRDIPTGAGSQGRTYSVNSPTTIGKVNAGTWPAGLTSVSIKIRYRVFDVATF